MKAGAPTRRQTTNRAPKFLLAGFLVVIAVITAALGCQSLTPSSTAASPADVLHPAHRRSSPSPKAVSTAHRAAPAPPVAHHGGAGVADGVVPGGTTVFDDDVPAVANLDPNLARALRQAATDAARDDHEFLVNSGWRSRQYQEQLLDEAVSKYGSREEAARWVATPTTSAHVSGEAVDLGHSDATSWLSKHGARYGLCQIYRNEPWHYELRPDAVAHGCPAMYADPTEDPRMQR
jgi:zinc D-Ala-D-Ala carboxypeptidase